MAEAPRGGRQSLRVAILSDVHGNLPALEAVLADARSEGAVYLIVAGDSTGGSHSRQVVEQLRNLGATAIRGNNEDYVLAYDRGEAPADWYTASRWAPVRLVHRQFDVEGIAYLASLPQQMVVVFDEMGHAAAIRVVHGSPYSPIEHTVPEGDPEMMALFRRGIVGGGPRSVALAKAVACVEEPVLICGHSHIQWQMIVDGCHAINPGSVGGPINGDWRPQYALLAWTGEQWQVELRRVAYDRAESWKAAHESGFLERGGAFARACLLNIEQGLNVPGYLVDHAIRLAATTGHTWNEMPEEVWAQAVDTFDWSAHPAVHELASGRAEEGG